MTPALYEEYAHLVYTEGAVPKHLITKERQNPYRRSFFVEKGDIKQQLWYYAKKYNIALLDNGLLVFVKSGVDIDAERLKDVLTKNTDWLYIGNGIYHGS
jgi:hypothetical protein